jgi:hypothetical protein
VEGAFVAGASQADDAAFHVGLAYELTLGYPPQVPGLSRLPAQLPRRRAAGARGGVALPRTCIPTTRSRASRTRSSRWR